MSKMGSHDPFRYLKHVVAQRRARRQIVNLIPTIQSRESPWFPCVQVACHIPLKIFEGYNFSSHFTSIGGLHTNLWDSTIVRVPILRIGNPKTKWHLGVGLMSKHKICYKGEGSGFLQVRVMVSLVNPCLPMVYLCTKNAIAKQ
jgi:hypothetical protein